MKTYINAPEAAETIEILLTPEKTPIAYGLKLKELIECGMEKADAEKFISEQPIELELIYSYNLGLWAVESEALDSIEPYCPYSGIQIEEHED